MLRTRSEVSLGIGGGAKPPPPIPREILIRLRNINY